jgi:hypothetical protein
VESLQQILAPLLCLGVLVAIVAFVLLVIFLPIVDRLRGRSPEPDDEQELCSGCGYDVRTLMRCPECGFATPKAKRRALAKLRSEWPTEQISPRQPRPDEKPVVILTTDNQSAARLMRDHLQARGITAKLNEAENLYGTVYISAKTSYRLAVWSDDEERARAIVEHLWPKELRM